MSNEAKNTKNKKIKTGLDVKHAPDPTVDPGEYNLDNILMNLIWSEPFFGAAITMIPRREDWTCDTAWMGVSRETYQPMLGYNPDFMRQLKREERIGVLKHELLHWLFLHVTDRNVADRKRAQLWNIACDLAINSIICAESETRLPDWTMLPGRAPKTDDPKLAELFKTLPKLQNADFYMEKLEEYAQENGKTNEEGNYQISIGSPGQGQPGDGGEEGEDGAAEGMTMDDHSSWGNLPEEVRDILREQANEVLGRAVKAAQARGWGTVPSATQQKLIEMLSGKADWRSILRNFIGTCRSIQTESSMKRINKKMPYIFPGKKRNTVARLLWAVDQSGSMSDEMVQRGLAEANSFSKLVEADMINFDTEIDPASLQTIKNGKLKWDRTRCGGTDFNCVARYVNDPKNRGKWTGVIIMTDGYAPVLSRMVGVRVLWLITPDGTMDAVRTGDLVLKMDKDRTAKRKT